MPEWIAILTLFLIVIGMVKKIISIRDSATLFAIAIALVPFAVFNQQVVTGRSLQPIHYQVFIGNYVAMLALVVVVGLLGDGVAASTRADPQAKGLGEYLRSRLVDVPLSLLEAR